MITGNMDYPNRFKSQKRNHSSGLTDLPVVTFAQLVETFPRITNKSKELAKKILPLHASPDLAALVAALMTDGHVDWYTSDGSPRSRKIILYSSNKAECEWFLSLVRKVFGAKGEMERYAPKAGYFKKQPYKAVVWNAVVARILILAGAPAGNKTEKKFLVPEWVLEGDTEIKREFLRTFFTFEASKPHLKSNRGFSFEISLLMVKTEKHADNAFQFFHQIKTLLKEFRMNPTRTISFPKKHGFKASKLAFTFSIIQQQSIVNFYRYVGYFNPEKQVVLKDAVLKISKFGRVREKPICALISELKEVFGTDRNLSTEINKFTEKKYSNRQVEHFRRNETTLPLEFLSALIRIKKDKAILKELPEYAQFLYGLNSSVPLNL